MSGTETLPAPPQVSLVLPIRNEAGYLDACLDAVGAQTYPRELIEILVVDGRSEDETVTVVERRMVNDARIRLISNPQTDMAHGLNLGIGAAQGDLVGVVSGHSVLSADYVARCVEALERTGAWSVGGRIVRLSNDSMHGAIALATASPVGVGDSAHNYATEPGWAETVFPGFWRRELFDKVGLFDPAMTANEDNELSYRIRRAGGGIWYEPTITVEYVPRSTLGGLFHQYRRYALGKIRVFRKHRGGLRWRHLVPAAWVAFIVAGGMAIFFEPVVAILWLGMLGVYVAVVAVAGWRLREPSVAWWQISLALLTLHVGYGTGTWQGLISWLARI